MSKEQTNSGWRKSGTEWDEARSQIRELQGELDLLRQQVGADILAFYLACDPFVKNYLRCLVVQGAVKYPEACSHFRLRRLDSITSSAFFPEAGMDPLRSGHDDDERIAALLRQRSDLLFGDFVTRERIASRGWLLHRDPETARETALLTVNFRRSTSRSEWDRVYPLLNAAFSRLLAGAGIIQRKLQEKSFGLVPAFLRMLEVADPLRQPEMPVGIPELMKQLLQCAVVPLDGPDRRWCGTVHKITQDGQALELVARVGDFPKPPRTVHELAKGEGVISWVALRKQAVRIKELDISPFRAISVEYLSEAHSQLAVPILIRGRVWGTLSLETTVPDFFRFQEVGYLTRVASLAAMAAVQLEFERVREERDIYLEAAYSAKRAQALARPLASFEELVRTSTNQVQFDR